ncbi:MAG TPA: glucoamylase family protein, partial [Gemmatimonadales bacterium]|nr:glucoamylase family protein [Gemmatimonadales bacterium]
HGTTLRTMWPAVAIAVLVLAAVTAVAVPEARADERLLNLTFAVAPLVVLWTASPAIAHALSAPAVPSERRLPAPSRAAAIRYALLHWRFFERFVTRETQWLAPDNFQEDPIPVVAMRTSPTNVGLQLLSTVSAYDLGFITAADLAGRLERAMQSLERMHRFRGHFYNWYDLTDLRVLEPAYISTVDSGNLAGHLIALRQALHGIADEPVFDARFWRAIQAGLGLADERLAALGTAPEPEPGLDPDALEAARAELGRAAASVATAAEAGAPRLLASQTAPALARALQQVEAVVASGPARQRATEWIEWAADLIHGLVPLLDQIDIREAPGRGARPTTTSESYRELAGRSAASAELLARLDALAERAYAYVREMDFRFLYDDSRALFAIGYQSGAHALDGSYYDLLASEARLASFIAVAKNEVPVEHWFRLGRTLTHAAGENVLVSWSGSMFEYLMPSLVMRSFPFTVLDATYRSAIHTHVAYGAERDVPWGVSESAYNIRDRHQTYQYRAFGVPSLGLKRGLGRDLVVAPYASALAALVDPQRAIANLRLLESTGALGAYGFRDAIDYTRPTPGFRFAVVQCYMAHHLGMSLVALSNVLTAQLWQRRFHADPMVRSVELLLHERVPRRLVLQEPQVATADEALPDPDLDRPVVREIETPDTRQPHVALLGQLPYTIMVSHCGGGYSRFEDLAVTRWRADGTRDDTGQFCYVQDLTSGRAWSAAYQPTCAPPDEYDAFLATDRVTIQREDGEIETRTEIAVVPADAAEVRRVTLTNNGVTPRDLQLTSYGEIVIAPPDADRAHPAFGNLFVETEYHAWCTAITATRRPRSARERPVWCVHVVDTGAERIGPVSCETDRARFLGRGRAKRDPAALESPDPLSGTTGAVLDPIFALRTRVRLEPGQSASVAFTTLVATTRERAFELADRYHDSYSARRALDLAWTSTQVELRELGITPSEAAVFQELAGHLFYSNPAVRASAAELMQNRGSQPLLWSIGVSGDWPIVFATIDGADGLPTLRQLFAAHHYWRRRGMMVDLVVLNTHPSGYFQELQERINAAMLASRDAEVIDRPGGVFVRQRDRLSGEVLLMVRATARVHIHCDGRSLGRILEAATGSVRPEVEPVALPLAPPRPSGRTPTLVRALQRVRARVGALGSEPTPVPLALPGAHGKPSRVSRHRGPDDGGYPNGFGALTPRGDYEIRLTDRTCPPAPWANVIANRVGGFVVTERGGGFAWADSSYFFRLTPWHNDPVGDPASEVVYLRDLETGETWSATPAPLVSDGSWTVRHGPGTSSFEHHGVGIATHLVLGLAPDEAVKLSLLRITNLGDRTRRLAVTSFVEWTLGALREHTQHQVHTALDPELGALFAWNRFDPQFAGHVAFSAMSEPLVGFTADRREFLGRNGTVAAPRGLTAELGGVTGAGLDPCAALQCVLELGPGEARELVVILGAAAGEDEARAAVVRYRDLGRAKEAAAATVAGWERRLSTISVRTPEPTFDAMVNRWTLYQALACRMWARSALYQSSGAYGFRDQLQDVMAFVYAEPALAREHILRAAGRQFVEGDVQHWWHPESGRGVRTRFSDD